MANALNPVTKLRIKVCGMRDASNIIQVAAHLPDYMGFIHYPASPRFVGSDFSLTVPIPDTIKRVGVFVDETLEGILRKKDSLGFDHVQLHGNESAALCATLQDQGLKVIKVFAVDDKMDFRVTKLYVPHADYFLFDTKGKYYGGNAKVFDWEVLNRYDQEVPFFLSGGLSADHVEAVSKLRGMNLHALDLNSGIEASPGLKSIEKLTALLSRLPQL